MALVDPYAPCHCGSGQKYKWCCQSVESYVERSQRLLDNGQYELAINPLLDGLAKVPDNVSLLLRKALVQLHLNQAEPAAETLRLLLQKNPGHLGGSILMTRLALDTEGPQAGVAQFQQALSARGKSERSELASLAAFLGSALAKSDYPAAAIKHLELAAQFSGDEAKRVASHLQNLRVNPAVSIWEKNPYRLLPAPERASEAFRESFEQAIGWAQEGLWSSAASAFELLAAGSSAGVLAERNRGICCLWLADHEGAVAALRRYISRTKPTTDSVDLEALCQQIEPPLRHEIVDIDRLSWPIRNREGLLAALSARPEIAPGDDRALDHHEANVPEAKPLQSFLLLDRPAIEPRPGLSRLDVPVVEAEVLVDRDVVYLEAIDDGRLDRLIDRFTTIAGSNIPPAHPRTKIIATEPRHEMALVWRWHLPTGLSDEEDDRLKREQVAHIVTDVWPSTPHPSLRRRTPLQAAQAGDSETFLRASIRRMEFLYEKPNAILDWDALRTKLHLNPEPSIEPDSLEIEQLHLSRLASVPVDRLDDDRLLALYRQAAKWGLRRLKNQVARSIDQRASLAAIGRLELINLYGDLAVEAAHDGRRPEAEQWLSRGRQAEPPQKRSQHALAWEMIGLEVKMLIDEPEVWVPVLAVILERCRGNNEATSAVLLRLVSLGLVQAGVDPKRPDQLMLDTQMLEQYLKRYGPRVTTAAGELGVAASQAEIWTPSSTGAPSPIWTPGSAAAPARSEEKSKLILPGQ
jgi:tetratricopeptide (TPR) repeat protein